jgi:hypothetical protein
MKKFLCITIAFSAALAIRLYPVFLSGLPFSTDAWSPIRNTELLLEHTPISLENPIMDGYNSYWPANSLFGAVFSQIIGLKPMMAMAIGIPVVGALTIPIFYTLIYRVSQSFELAFFSSILLATIYPYAHFTAGVTKETYANPLYMLLILIFLSHGKWRKMILFAIASLALVMAHHLTTFVTIAILASIALGSFAIRIKRGISHDNSSFLPVAILTALTILYFGLYAYRGWKITITPSEMFSVASYMFLAFAITLYFVLKPQKPSSWKTLITCITATTFAFLIAFLLTKRPITPEAPILPGYYMLYAVPFILMAPLIAFGIEELRSMHGKDNYVLLFWFSILVGLEAYAVFGDSPLGLTLIQRILNFLCIPLIILSAFGLLKLYKIYSNPRKQIMAKTIAIIGLIAIVVLNSYNMYASVNLQERYMGYYWFYNQPEYYAATWIKGVSYNQTIAGDMKVSYLLKGYFDLKVNVPQGLQYFMEKTSSKPKILFTYDQMLRNGFAMYGGYSINLPENWTEKLYELNLLYSNGPVNIYGE